MTKVWRNTPENFLLSVQRTDGCHLWMGKAERSGYGRVSWYGKKRLAHRVAAYLNGILADLDSTEVVMHSCDNRLCCNPEHLCIGSQSDNMRDAVSKGRMWMPDNRGTRSANAKLTEADVAAIRARYAEGGVSQERIGAQYGVSQMVVSRIVRGVSYHG